MEVADYLKVIKRSFLSNLTQENNCSLEQAESLYQLLEETIVFLSKSNMDEHLTKDILAGQIKGLKQGEQLLVENWLFNILLHNCFNVYAYNFLVHKFNKEMDFDLYQKKDVAGEISREDVPQSKLKDVNDKTTHLTINQIALKYVYEGKQITREGIRDIPEARHLSSGEKLFQRFEHYSSTSNRKGKPFPNTPRKLKNKILLIESVANLLSEPYKQRALDELKILESIYKVEFD